MLDDRLLLSLIALIYRKLVAGLKTIITSASGGAGSLVYFLSIESVLDATSSATNKIVIMSMERFEDAYKNNAKRK